MDKYCERCYARDAKPCMECSTCNPGHRNFRPALVSPPTNADRIRGMSDKELTEFLASVFCAGMSAEEHGDDFHHSFPWTLDRLRQPAEE